jgi:hypothetical protein
MDPMGDGKSMENLRIFENHGTSMKIHDEHLWG